MKRVAVPLSTLLLPLSLASAATLAACQGCRQSPAAAAGTGEPPTLRLYLLSTVAGALEPCGCSKNQLGGFDRLGAFVTAHAAEAPRSLVAAAGPLFFLDPTARAEQATQDEWKAEAIADALGKMGFAGFAPGVNDWAGGAPQLASLVKRSGGAEVAANLSGETGGSVPAVVREVGGLKVGLVGVSAPVKMGAPPIGVSVGSAAEGLRAGIKSARDQGARVLVGLFAMPRGEALRLAEQAPELAVVVVGKPFEQGDGNDRPAPPELLGSTLVVEPANHLQTAAVVDLYVRGDQLVFQDAAGLGRQAERQSLSRQIEDLERKIRAWEQLPAIDPKDLQARSRDLAQKREALRALETPSPPGSGSFFRYTMQEVRPDLGRDPAIAQAMLGYYRRVNDHNRTAFADRKPAPPAPGQAGFIGEAACSSCHPGAKAVWEKTQHAHAYATLSDQHKEFNLDCVSCHVTGYQKPGGSTVTFNAQLQNVQCEECHGPGEKHRQSPTDKTLIKGKPSPDACVSSCHHPPHVEGFDPVAQMFKILGPGHGNPDEWPPKKPR